jgi:type I restriction enzyme, R subunit
VTFAHNQSRYHNNALTMTEVIEELIRLALDIRVARARGEETGLTDEEAAFCDALAENESARQVMGESTLRVIAHEFGWRASRAAPRWTGYTAR